MRRLSTFVRLSTSVRLACAGALLLGAAIAVPAAAHAAPAARTGQKHASAAPSSPGTFVPVAPKRILDTRTGQGGKTPGRSGVVPVQVLGVGGVQDGDVSAVALNLTAVAPTASGYISAFVDGAPRSTTSDLSFAPGQTVANLAIVPVGENGKIDLFNGSTGSTPLLADVVGYYLGNAERGATGPGTFTPLASSTRLLDTRSGSVHAPASGGTVALPVLGRGNVPDDHVSAVVLNVTATSARTSGYLTVFASGTRRPTASSVNFVPSRSASNRVIAPVGSDGKVDIYNGSGGIVQVIADVTGYVTSGYPVDSGAYDPLAPARLLDTRSRSGGTAPGPNGSTTVQITGRGGVPAQGVSAVALNVTAVGASQGGHVTVFASGARTPETSNISFAAGQTKPNLVLVPVGSNGKIVLFNGSTGNTQLIIDVSGFYRSDSWQLTELPLADGQDNDANNAISCVSRVHCVVAGTSSGTSATGAEENLPFVATLNDGSVTSSTLPLPDGYGAGGLFGISCTSTDACTAVGNTTKISDQSTHALIETMTSEGWSAQALPEPSVYTITELSAVSCVDAATCTAAGTASVSEDGGEVGVLETLTDGAWSPHTLSVPSGYAEANLYGISCDTATTCTAVGDAFNRTDDGKATYVPLAATGVNNGYHSQTAASPNSALPNGILLGVSCRSGVCHAAGGIQNASGSVTESLVATPTNTSLGLQALPDPAGYDNGSLYGISCVSSTECTAAGEDNPTGQGGIGQPLTQTLSGGVWTADHPPAPNDEQDDAGSGVLQGVSCTSAEDCTAVGNNVEPAGFVVTRSS